MEYNKLFNVALKGMEKNRVKIGEYDGQKAIIIDECYLILVPDRDFLLDMEKCLKKCNQVTPVDCSRMFAHERHEREAEERPLQDTKFISKINGVHYHYFTSANGEKLYFREEAFSYLSKWEDLQVCKKPGRAQPGYIYAVGNITRLVGMVMPMAHNKATEDGAALAVRREVE